MVQGQVYSIREAEKSETRQIVDLQKRNYIYEETIHNSYISRHENDISEEEIELMKDGVEAIQGHMISNNPCLVAVHRESNKIVGRLVLHINHDETNKFAQLSIRSKTHRDIISYVKPMVDKTIVFNNFPEANKLLQFRHLHVDKNHTRKGLATALIKEAIVWGKKNGFDVAYDLFTSMHAKKAAEKLGMKIIAHYDLRDFRDFEGFTVFADAAPHNVVSLLAIDLQI